MVTETSGLGASHDQYGNRYEYDDMGHRYVVLDPMTIDEWRRERIVPRLRELGWDVPQLGQLEGYRLFQLERLLKEAGMLRGFQPRPAEGSIGEALSGATIGGTKPTKGAILDQLRKAAEALLVECEYNQIHVGAKREARIMHEQEMERQAAAMRDEANAKKNTAKKVLDTVMEGYHP